MKSLSVARIALAGAALVAAASAQTTLQGMGTLSGLQITDVSADGSAVVGSTGSAIYLWTTTNPAFTQVATGAGGDADVSNGGTYISATRNDPNNANLKTAARLEVATGTWTYLPGLGGVSGTSLSSTYDMSADGQTIVGLAWVTANNAHAFRWTSSVGTTDLGTLQGTPSNPSSSRANAVSADGTTVVGWDSDPNTGVWRAARWDANGVESLLGCLDPIDPINGPSQSYAVSADGSYIAGESSTGLSTPSGWSEQHGFRWDALNGLIDMGTTPVDPFGWGTHNTLPSAISADGLTAVGIAGVGPFGRVPYISRFGGPTSTLQAYLVALGVPQASSWTFSNAVGMSADGRVICGMGLNPSSQQEAFRITLAPLSETYCTAKVNSLGCTPAISADGIASLTSGLPFTVGATNVISQKSGLLYYGFSPLAGPFQGGIKCVGSPTIRTPLQQSGGSLSGNDCTGTYAYDFNARIQSGVDPLLVAGTVVYAQYWSRDPASLSTTGLTDGLSFTVFP